MRPRPLRIWLFLGRTLPRCVNHESAGPTGDFVGEDPYAEEATTVTSMMRTVLHLTLMAERVDNLYGDSLLIGIFGARLARKFV